MHNGEHELTAGPLPTHQDVARDVLGRFQDLGHRYWGWVTVLAFLFVLGVVGFIIRLSEGFSDENRANWGYFVATLAFIVTTFRPCRLSRRGCVSRRRTGGGRSRA